MIRINKSSSQNYPALLKSIPKNETILEYIEDFEIYSFNFVKMGAYF